MFSKLTFMHRLTICTNGIFRVHLIYLTWLNHWSCLQLIIKDTPYTLNGHPKSNVYLLHDRGLTYLLIKTSCAYITRYVTHKFHNNASGVTCARCSSQDKFLCPGGGGHYHWKVVWGCAAVMTPFFRASRRSLASQFTINAPFMCPPFQFLENFAFSALFWAKISALKTQNFWIFAPKTPQFSRKTCSLDPTFGNPCGTYPPKKKIECPPRVPMVWDPSTFLSLLIWGSFKQYNATRIHIKLNGISGLENTQTDVIIHIHNLVTSVACNS